ncbi:serine carboxypeptidase-like 7 isoform X2 [Triticum dicoccoides]|uniref:serine carboxypeptidase-like 7 isoform X2 n=1 Tax=Triticum dicoccoides TaxID=85692 RepID=UPI00188FE29E|nr:serine carboxypeptidase-like 7 isoform X2 [Triticum dicoccoides]
MIPIKPPCSRTTREQKESSQVVLCKLGTSSMIRRLLLLLCQLALAAAASSSKVVTSLPGFQGRLPFHLETGYVEVDEDNGTELFYYFVESEARGENDPFLLWLTGGDHCSVLSGLAFEIGPFNFVVEPYNGTIPSLEINPNSWTKVAHILFVDSPAGAGFSFSRQPKGYHVGEVSTSLQLHEFLIKWIRDHPKFLSSPLYIGGDSYAGKIVPFIAQKISKGNKVGRRPLLNLKGYLLGNPATGERIDESSKVPFAHGFGIISDQLYETILGHCQGQDYKNPTNVLCAKALGTFHSLLSEVMLPHILWDKCVYSSAGPHAETDDSAGAGRKILSEEAAGIKMRKRLKHPPVRPPLDCINYAHYLSYFWANDERTRDALGVKDGTVDEWVRCQDGGVPYTRDIASSIKYHRNVTANGYRALVYSGDHDSVVPHLGTQAWVRSLDFPIVDEWRAWHLHGQSAGFTVSYSNNMTFATVKGAGHTAPEYEPEKCFAMFSRWILNQPL